jgi:hypothetical protein
VKERYSRQECRSYGYGDGNSRQNCRSYRYRGGNSRQECRSYDRGGSGLELDYWSLLH